MLAVHVACSHQAHIVCLETQAANVVTASRSINGNILVYYKVNIVDILSTHL